MIAVLRLPWACAAMEQHRDPELRSQPLLLMCPDHPTPRIVGVSSQAAAFGVVPGMPLRQGRLCCPTAVEQLADTPAYETLLDQLLALLGQWSDRVAPLLLPWRDGEAPMGAVEIALDLDARAHAQSAAVARELGRSVRKRWGFETALGLGANPFVATVAARQARVGHLRVIEPTQSIPFLAPLPIDVLPLDKQQKRWLDLLGLHTVGALAALPTSALVAQLGLEGRRIHALAHGHDDTPLPRLVATVPLVAQRQCEPPIADRLVLATIVAHQSHCLALQLERRGVAARRVRLTLTLDNKRETVEELCSPTPIATEEQLQMALHQLVARAGITSPIVAVQSSLYDLAPLQMRQQPLALFEADHNAGARTTLPDLVARWGSDCIRYPKPTPTASYLPEHQWSMHARGV